MKLNIAVIEGGYSHEKIISLKSSKTVFKNLNPAKYSPYLIRIDEEGWFWYDGETKRTSVNKDDFSIVVSGNVVHFDCAFIVIHGTPGEDGKLQGYFDLLKIPYTTCNQVLSALTFNKFICNQYLRNFDIPIADSRLINRGSDLNKNEISQKIGYPCFVKPVDGGSSFGVTKVTNENQLDDAVNLALEHGTAAVIEAFLNGREVTNGVFRGLNGIHVLPITEIVTQNGFFDFNAKYNGESQEITPANLPEEISQKVKELTHKIYHTLNLTGIARVDYILHNNKPHLVEINTVPGQTEESIIPQMARAEGRNLEDLYDEIITLAIKK